MDTSPLHPINESTQNSPNPRRSRGLTFTAFSVFHNSTPAKKRSFPFLVQEQASCPSRSSTRSDLQIKLVVTGRVELSRSGCGKLYGENRFCGVQIGQFDCPQGAAPFVSFTFWLNFEASLSPVDEPLFQHIKRDDNVNIGTFLLWWSLKVLSKF